MPDPARQFANALTSTASATVDLFLALVGTAVAVALPLDAANTALGYPVPGGAVGSAATLVGAAATYPFVSGAWSLDRFLEFVFTAVVTFLLVAVVLSLPLYFVFGVSTGADIAGPLQFAFVAVAYVVAAVDVYWIPVYRI